MNNATTIKDKTQQLAELGRIANNSPAVIFVWTAGGDWTVELVSESIRQFGVDPDDFVEGRLRMEDIVHPDDYKRIFKCKERFSQKQNPGDVTCEFRMLTASGEKRWMDARFTQKCDENGHLSHHCGILFDITERKTREESLFHDAFYDKLTGLPNAALFADRVRQAIKAVKRRPDRLFAVILLDFDRFKVVYDSFGPKVGQQLLCEMGQRLQGALRTGDSVAYLGGDRFAMFVDDINDISDTVRVTKRMQRAISVPVTLNGQVFGITASVGIVVCTPEDTDYEDVLRNADMALCEAKKGGTASHQVFDREMHATAVSRLSFENDLKQALENREFHVVYQPIVSLGTGEIRGFEALLRWQSPTRGPVQPADFIPVAEEIGLIVPLGLFVLQTACREIALWNRNFPRKAPFFLSINASGRQFSESTLPEHVRLAISETGFDPSWLVLEITETVMMKNVEATASALRELKRLGVRISIDDFGTGYSSLAYLRKFSVDILKIDRSFISAMNTDKKSLEIIRTIVTLAQNFGMRTTAEGIETEAQRAQVEALRCDFGQGYLFGKPQDMEMTESLLVQNIKRKPYLPAQAIL